MRLTDFTHHLWQAIVPKGATVIDATCGAGFDTLFLAKIAKHVIAYDIQPLAIEKTKKLLESSGMTNVELHLACHTTIETKAHLIVYNLGYLPGSDKTLSTTTSRTLESLQKAKELILPGGWISLMCYDGHLEGKKETCAIMDLAKKLDRAHWDVHLHRLWNTDDGPKLLLIRRRPS